MPAETFGNKSGMITKVDQAGVTSRKHTKRFFPNRPTSMLVRERSDKLFDAHIGKVCNLRFRVKCIHHFAISERGKTLPAKPRQLKVKDISRTADLFQVTLENSRLSTGASLA